MTEDIQEDSLFGEWLDNFIADGLQSVDEQLEQAIQENRGEYFLNLLWTKQQWYEE